MDKRDADHLQPGYRSGCGELLLTPASASARPGESLRSHFVRGTLGVGSLSALHGVMSLLCAVILARFLGAEGYGYYAFALAVMGGLAIPAELGLAQLVTREVAATHAREQWGFLRGLRKRAFQLGAGAAIFSAAVLGGIVLALSRHVPAIDPATLTLALLLLPLMVASAMMAGLLRGLRRVVQAFWPLAALKPLLLVTLVVIPVGLGISLRPPEAMLANITATLASVGVLAALLVRYWPVETRHAKAEFQTRTWLSSLLPFTMIAGVNFITQKTDIIMLGMLGTASDVGVYQIVVSGGMVVSFGFTAINSVLGPNVARLYVRGETAQLQRLMATTSAIIFGIALAVMVLFYFIGEALLQHVFGEEFRRGYPALLIFGAGQLINAGVGSVGTFLSMTGHERDTLVAISMAAVANIVLNALLIPAYGMVGAATATALATALWNLMMAIAVHKRLGLVPGPIRLKGS